MVDQRKNERDNLYLYEPPDHTKVIPENAVPEWYIASSKQCVLPDMNGRDHGVGEKWGGAMLTISFHVKRENVTKCYLYYNGQGILTYADGNVWDGIWKNGALLPVLTCP